ncbi:hypothetical protein IMY05_C4593000300 [Salix suchowensis]|nr:hypothetical protein IMY05_C4593000300 [Salix suchowensis]
MDGCVVSRTAVVSPRSGSSMLANSIRCLVVLDSHIGTHNTVVATKCGSLMPVHSLWCLVILDGQVGSYACATTNSPSNRSDHRSPQGGGRRATQGRMYGPRRGGTTAADRAGGLGGQGEVLRTMQEILSHLEMCFGEDDMAAYTLRDIDDDFSIGAILELERRRMSYEQLEGVGFPMDVQRIGTHSSALTDTRHGRSSPEDKTLIR